MELKKILSAVSEITDVEKSKIQGTDRFKKTMAARHLFCYFARTKTNATLLQIGNMLNRHHSTVINSLQLISDMIDIGDEDTKNSIQKIDDYIKHKYQQDIILKIILPFDVDIEKVNIFLKNEAKAKCVEKL
jgi:hypothetical protein